MLTEGHRGHNIYALRGVNIIRMVLWIMWALEFIKYPKRIKMVLNGGSNPPQGYFDKLAEWLKHWSAKPDFPSSNLGLIFLKKT